MLAVLKKKDFRNLFIAGSISEFGSFITDTALTLYLFDLTSGQISFMGLSKMSFMLMLTIGSIFGGTLGEKFSRKKILIFCELIRIPVVIGILMSKNPYVLVFLSGILALFTGIFNPSRQTMTNDLLGNNDDINKANNLFSSFAAASHILGPLLGATIYAQLKNMNLIIGFDTFTYIFGIWLLLKIPFVHHKQQATQESYLQNIIEGFKYSFKRKDLRTLYFNIASSGFAMGIFLPLMLPFTKQVLAKGDQEYGVLITLFGIGGILAGLITSKLNSSKNIGKKLYALTMTEFIFFTWWNNNQSYEVALIISVLWGIFVFMRFPLQLSYVSLTVESNMLTRSHGMRDIAFFIPNIFGTFVIIIFGNNVPIVTLMNYTSIIVFIILLIRLPLKSSREFLNKTI